jgi:uncharacterized damage-inducible protein DinB
MLEALLDSWDRNNTILINLRRAVPDDALDIRPIAGSHTIGELFMHMHYCRLIFVVEDAPEFATAEMPTGEWAVERDGDRMVQMLNESARSVRVAVEGRLKAGREMDTHYDHPVLMLQHLIWHEGYHHGQIKLTLKLAGRPWSDHEAGLVTWDVWMDKSEPQQA